MLKSNSQIFERTSHLNIEKLRENLNLKRSANREIDDKRYYIPLSSVIDS